MATHFGEKTRGWQVAGQSVRGASHIRSGLPNQDALGWAQQGDSGDGLLLAVADGHGSAKCFRSDRGSQFAVDIAISVLNAVDMADPDEIPREVVNRWRQAVQNHLCNHPLSMEELRELERRMGAAARRAVESDPVLAYGSTLLAAAVSDSLGVYLQLGDGDILTVSEESQVTRPWSRNQELGDETTSLATRNAAGAVRLHVTRSPAPLPELILLATDGYANSFREDRGFLEVGSDLLQMIRTEGIGPITAKLECWLSEASEYGSGDDITLGILWRGLPAAGEP